jgi:hypothetical protein
MRVLVFLVACFILFTSGWTVIWTENPEEIMFLKIAVVFSNIFNSKTDQSDFFVNSQTATFLYIPDDKFALGIVFQDALNTPDMFVYGTLFVPLLMLLWVFNPKPKLHQVLPPPEVRLEKPYHNVGGDFSLSDLMLLLYAMISTGALHLINSAERMKRHKKAKEKVNNNDKGTSKNTRLTQSWPI